MKPKSFWEFLANDGIELFSMCFVFIFLSSSFVMIILMALKDFISVEARDINLISWVACGTSGCLITLLFFRVWYCGYLSDFQRSVLREIESERQRQIAWYGKEVENAG